jgi:uncharacterized membrane protein
MSTSVAPRSTRPPSSPPWRVVGAWVALILTPVELVLGFVLGYAIGLDPSVADPVTGWDAAWRVVVLWMCVVAASLTGTLLSIAARRRGEPSATAALVLNVLALAGLTFVTLVTGLLSAAGMAP